MKIKDQIMHNESKKGKKDFMIDSEESVEWFMRKMIHPYEATSSYHRHKNKKGELIDSGEMPQSLEQHMKNIELERSVGK